jgi:DNA (cytosine-5)-methyltransferase 1
MKAIDFYSGIGGWSLGLKMAGIEVVSSYEWWGKANLTNFNNNRHKAESLDIRTFDPATAPKVDVVVGSPPCTHFSLANRGGKGNISEGLKDVEKFLEIVAALKPRFWAMENVPRLASIVCRELNQGGSLHRFCPLDPTLVVVDSSEWGVPQRRQRCIIGNFDFDRLMAFRDETPSRTLGGVLKALSSDPVIDPIYGTKCPRADLVDHEEEAPFSPEEQRLNKDLKTYHPVYNNMSFPDSLEKPARTVTATSTRVSRESIVVETPRGFRRPTLRESACLQSFPINYQFFGDSHAQKLKMIGNAVPPLLTFYIAHAMLGTEPSDLPKPSEAISNFAPPTAVPIQTKPEKVGCCYAPDRKFRSAIPNLRFKSGMRFELGNSFERIIPEWRIKFFFGGSKKIQEIPLGTDLLDEIRLVRGGKACVAKAMKSIVESGDIVNSLNATNLQDAWIHKSDDFIHPHDLVDAIGRAVALFMDRDSSKMSSSVVSGIMSSRHNPPGFQKVERYAPAVFAGFLVGSLINEML